MEEWQIKHCRLFLRPSLLYSNMACSKSAVIVDCFCNSFLLYSKLLYCLICYVMFNRIMSYRHCYINRMLNRFNCRLNSCEMFVISGQSRTEEVGELLIFHLPLLLPSLFLPLSIHFPFFLFPSSLTFEGGPLKYS